MTEDRLAQLEEELARDEDLCLCGHQMYLHDDGFGACVGCSRCLAFDWVEQ